MAKFAANGVPKRILFFTVDTLSANHLSTYGYARKTSPALSELGKKSVVFENAIAPAPWTYPSYASQLTSRHSLTTMGYKAYRIPDSEKTLAEYFKELGYVTAGFVDNQYLFAKHGMHQGFDHYEEYHNSNRKSLHRALKWIEEHPDIPFFVFAHTNDVHGPYVPEEPWKRIFDHDEYWGEEQKVPIARSRLPHAFGVLPRIHVIEERQDINFYRARYDAVIRQTDHEFERMLSALKEIGDFDDTLVIFSSDHGESLGNHNFYLNHGLVYEDIIRVPLVIKFHQNLFAGRRVDTQVSLVDLLPTVLDIYNLKSQKPLAGKSLLPLLRGEQTVLHENTFASQGIFEQFMIRDDEWKLIKFIPGSAEQKQAWITFPNADLNDPKKVFLELYNHRKDPEEKHNLADKHPERVRQMLAELETWIAKPEDFIGENVQLDKNDLKRLRELGYIE